MPKQRVHPKSAPSLPEAQEKQVGVPSDEAVLLLDRPADDAGIPGNANVDPDQQGERFARHQVSLAPHDVGFSLNVSANDLLLDLLISQKTAASYHQFARKHR
jgi:hypothetical protein